MNLFNCVVEICNKLKIKQYLKKSLNLNSIINLSLPFPAKILLLVIFCS